jgi:hypothetical protein
VESGDQLQLTAEERGHVSADVVRYVGPRITLTLTVLCVDASTSTPIVCAAHCDSGIVGIRRVNHQFDCPAVSRLRMVAVLFEHKGEVLADEF